jgi:hypothetical protein
MYGRALGWRRQRARERYGSGGAADERFDRGGLLILKTAKNRMVLQDIWGNIFGERGVSAAPAHHPPINPDCTRKKQARTGDLPGFSGSAPL